MKKRSLLLCGLCFVGLLVLVANLGALRQHGTDAHVANFRVLRDPKPEDPLTTHHPMVCIIGHLFSPSLAHALAQRWKPLHSFWSISGPSNASLHEYLARRAPKHGVHDGLFDVVDPAGQGLFHTTYCPSSSCSSKQGLTEALAMARASSVPCEYYFLLDGDQEWRLNTRFAHKAAVDIETELASELLRALATWKPAVLGFSSDPEIMQRLGAGPSLNYQPTSYQSADAAGRIQMAFKDDPVCPMTSVSSDSVYHASIIDFVLPLPANGEGGFYSNRTLPLAWLSALIPVVFQHNAIQLNSIRHKRLLPMQGANDSGPQQRSGDAGTTQAYLEFLKSGFKMLTTPADLALEDVDWRPRIGVPPYSPSLLERLNRVISQTHPAVAPSVSNFASNAPSARPKIIVLAQSTSSSLSQCLTALSRALYDSQYTISLEVLLMTSDASTAAVARRFQWTRGQYTVQVVSPAASAQAAIHQFTSLWHPVQRTEVALILDDTVQVSPYFFTWMVSCYDTASAPSSSSWMLGCALTPPPALFDGHMETNAPGPSIWIQDASAPAIVVLPRQWRDFLAWLGQVPAPRPELPGWTANVWPARTLLRRYLARFAVESGLVVAYPNIISHSLAVARKPLSLTDKDLTSGLYEPFPDVAPLLARSDAQMSGGRIPPSVLQVVPSSTYYDWAALALSANVLAPYPLSRFDKVTIIMPGYSRPDILAATARWYCRLRVLEEIVVVWNNLEKAPPTLKVPVGCRTRIVRQTENSLHNRFAPVSGIKTRAVFSVDDDVRLDLAAVVNAFRTWQMFPERMVGFIPTARGAALKSGSTTSLEYRSSYPEYIEDYRPVECPAPGRTNDMNFILTGGAIFDAKFLYKYTKSTEPAMVRGRALVTKYFNGEDILFAFMHAHATGEPPMVVKSNWDMKLMAGAPGLHKRVGHFANRGRILNLMMGVFGEFPLSPMQAFDWPSPGKGAPHLITCDTPLGRTSNKVGMVTYPKNWI